jgi:hypothetical protein
MTEASTTHNHTENKRNVTWVVVCIVFALVGSLLLLLFLKLSHTTTAKAIQQIGHNRGG